MPQRDAIKELSPPWLSEGNAERYLYTFGLASDALLEKMNQATLAHLPGLALDESAIPYQAEDRLLVQGPAESNDAFITRMRSYLTAWQHAGQRATILEQLKAYCANLTPGVVSSDPFMTIVGGFYQAGNDYTTWDVCKNGDAPSTPPTRVRVRPANWNWDNQQLKPWRSWLVMFMSSVATGQSGAAATVFSTGGSGVAGVTSGFATITGLSGMTTANVNDWITFSGAANAINNGKRLIVAVTSPSQVMIANPGAIAPDANSGAIAWSVSRYPFLAPAGVYGAPNTHWGDDGLQWGVRWAGHDVPQTLTSIRQILSRWKEAKTYYPNILVSFDGGDGTPGNQFSPLDAIGVGNPNGDYGDYGLNVNGTWVQRGFAYPLTAFIDGTGEYVRCNVHNVT
jgi:hypothetical protein